MTRQFWLYRWIDEHEISSERELNRALKGGGPLARLQQVAAEDTWGTLQPHVGSGFAIVAGRGADLSGDMDCCHSVCQTNQINDAFPRMLYYFDEVVVSGPPSHRFARLLERPTQQTIENIAEHAKALLYVRETGLESILSFAQKPPACKQHHMQHAEEAQIMDVLDRGRWWIDELATNGKVTFLRTHEDHWHYGFDHKHLEHTQTGSVASNPDGGPPSPHDIAADVYVQYAAHLTSDVLAARQLGLPLAPYMKVHEKALTGQSQTVSVEDVAFDLRLPIISNLPIRDVLAIRREEHESFRRFQEALTQAIQERIDAGEADPQIIASRIIDEVISPALNDISQRLGSASRILGRKGGVSVAVGSAITTVGLLTGVPLVTGMGIAALGTSVPAAHKYFDDKGAVELEDMYFLWRLERKAHGSRR